MSRKKIFPQNDHFINLFCLTQNLWIQFETWDSNQNGISNKEPVESNRLVYGQIKTIEKLSQKLKKKYGRDYSIKNLEQMRQFYLVYSKAQTSSAELQSSDFKLSWSQTLQNQKSNARLPKPAGHFRKTP